MEMRGLKSSINLVNRFSQEFRHAQAQSGKSAIEMAGD